MSVLFDCPVNPIPNGANADFITTVDGIQIRFAKWPAVSNDTRGTVLVLQGRGEYIEKYFEVVTELQSRGYAVVSFDWRGQGRSQRLLTDPEKSHVKSFAQYKLDFDCVFRDIVMKDCPSPFFVLAHSTGGAVTLSVIEKYQSDLDRIILSAPFVEFGNPDMPPWLIGVIGNFGSMIGLGRKSTPSSGIPEYLGLPVADSSLTSDRERYERFSKVLTEAPDLKVGPPTFSWVRAARKALSAFKRADFGKAIKLPFLIVAAGDDSVVSSVAAKQLSQKLTSAKFLEIKGAKHELLVETDEVRQQFWQAFDDFMDKK